MTVSQGSLTKLRRTVLAGTTILVATIASSIAIGSPAAADPASYAPYQLRVPVSVLADATSDDVDLTEAEQTAILANTSNGFTTFTPPVAPPTPVVAPPGTPITGGAGGAALPILGALIGFWAGGQAVQATGIDLEDRLCPGATTGNLADDFFAAVTGIQCSDWQIAEDVEERLNLDAKPQGDPALIGTIACDQVSRCAEVYAVAAPTSQYDGLYCLKHVSGPQFNANSVSRTPMIGITPTASAYWWGGFAYMDGSSSQPPTCPKIDGTQVGAIPVWLTGQAATNQYWAVDIQASSNSTYVAAVPTPLRENVLRTIRCVVSYVGGSVSASTSTFTLGSGNVPQPVCPSLPPGSFLMSVDLWLDSPGLASVLIGHSDSSNAFQDWADEYAECQDGSCTLDLQKNGSSCFSTVNCQGWIDAPFRDTEYTCVYANAVVSLSECFIYGPMFEASGPGYGDFTDGSALTVKTVPSEADELALELLDRGWLVHGPTPAGFVYGDTDPYVAARKVAATCVALGVQDECDDDIPIFAPGDNVREAAQHDLDAITLINPTWVQLTYTTSPPLASGWYSETAPCVTGSYNGLTHDCDEYPFRSTVQASTWSSLRVIDWADNQNEGTYLGIFYDACGVGDGDPFLVIPIPTPESLPRTTPTAAWCGS